MKKILEKKNEELIEIKRKKILDKYFITLERRIKRQKEENTKELLNKYLENAMKRQDILDNLRRYERKKRHEREIKIYNMLKRVQRSADFQREKKFK